MTLDTKTVLVFGSSGWIGGKIFRLLEQSDGVRVHRATARLENREDIVRELDEYQPQYVVNAAGVTGRPNVDWCETHKAETIRSNVIGCLNLVDVCSLRKAPVHVTVCGTGCIYEYDDDHPMGSDIGFTEDDPHNFFGSFYSKTKSRLEEMLRVYANVLLLRFRMPISEDLHPRSFVTKLTKYEKVIDIPNSVSILSDLLPVLIELTLHNKTGIYNFTNPGVITHGEVLSLYREHVDPSFVWSHFTVEEQDRILLSRRSNNRLDATKLLSFRDVPPVRQSLVGLFQRMAKATAAHPCSGN